MSKATGSPERSSHRLSTTFGYYLAFTTLGLIAAMMGPTLPALAGQVHAQLDDFSIVFTTRSTGYLIGSLVGGHTFDRVPGHPVIALMLAVIAAAILAIPLVPMLWLLAVVTFIIGIAESAVDVGCNSLLIWLHGEKVSPWMNGLHFCFGVGAFIAPIVIAQVVLATGNITWAYWTLALLILPGALWLPRLPSPPPLAAPHVQKTTTGHRPLVVLIAVFMLLYVGAESAFGGWVFTYATTLNLADSTMAAYLVAVYWGALTVGRFVGIPIAARVSTRAILVLDLLACLVGLGLVVVWSGSAGVLWFGAIILGLGMASIYPTMLAFAGERMTITGRITGAVSLGAGAGGMFLPWLTGQLFVHIGPGATMPLFWIDLAIALLLLLLLLVYAPRARNAI